MVNVQIITPVKDSWNTTLNTITCVQCAKTHNSNYTVYNDFSSENVQKLLEATSKTCDFELINIHELTQNKPPNYALVLQHAQQKAKATNAHLLIVESDVEVKEATITELIKHANQLENAGLIAAITTNVNGEINYPYEFAKHYGCGIKKTKKRVSFCCTLLTNNFLSAYDFKNLDPSKNWYDIFISRKSIKLGFDNYILMDLPVIHHPHSSRPWKHLKYSNPVKYYFLKFFVRNNDKI